MSKQRRINSIPGQDPALECASDLLQEYTRKLRGVSRRIRSVRDEYFAARQRRLREALEPNSPFLHSPEDQQMWYQSLDSYRSRQDEYTEYLRAIVPHAMKLGQHVSQLITHGTNSTIVKVELSLRVAELESAISTARALSSSNVAFQ